MKSYFHFGINYKKTVIVLTPNWQYMSEYATNAFKLNSQRERQNQT